MAGTGAVSGFDGVDAAAPSWLVFPGWAADPPVHRKSLARSAGREKGYWTDLSVPGGLENQAMPADTRGIVIDGGFIGL
jgi:hypothetical protein